MWSFRDWENIALPVLRSSFSLGCQLNVESHFSGFCQIIKSSQPSAVGCPLGYVQSVRTLAAVSA